MVDASLISITEAAKQRVLEIMHKKNAYGIKLGLKKGGCAGMEYTVDLVAKPDDQDDCFEFDGARVYVNPAAALFLIGTQLDFETTPFRSGFVFRNPNQVSACGCGESVELKPVDSFKM